jgi:hypothetical protein
VNNTSWWLLLVIGTSWQRPSSVNSTSSINSNCI